MSLVDDLEALRTQALQAFSQAQDAKALEALRIEYVGTRGKLKALLGRMGEVPKEQKPVVGKRANEIGAEIQAGFDSAKARVAGQGQGAGEPAAPASSFEALKQERATKLKAYEQKFGVGAAWGARFPSEQGGAGLTSLENIRQTFDRLDPKVNTDAATAQDEVYLAARVMLRRDQSKKLIFLTVQDQSGSIQVALWNAMLNDETLSALRDTLDLWDIVGIKGKLAFTQKGEATVWATEARILCKCMTPPPDKHHGIHDKEIRYRQRYLDLITSPESRKTFILRAKAVAGVRRYLDERGFLEMETPVLQTIPGGAAARPFETKLNALNIKMYLRIATEIPLKKLLVGGLDKVYDLGRIFRNEGMDARHNPEFTTVEIYQAYGDLRDMMALTEGVISSLAEALTGSASVTWRGRKVDLSLRELDEFSLKARNLPPGTRGWPCLDYCELLQKYAGVAADDERGLDTKLREKKIDPAGLSLVDKIDGVFGEYAEPNLWDAAFIVNQPVEMSPLCRAHPKNAKLADRFEAFAACMELGNAYSELNDPLEQRKRLVEQVKDHLGKDLEALLALIAGAEKQGGISARELSAIRDLIEAARFMIANLEQGAKAPALSPTSEGLFAELEQSAQPRHRELIKMRDRITDPSLLLDRDFVSALEYGMPPAGGLGIGIDRVIMLLANADSIRDVILFPLMRPENIDQQ